MHLERERSVGERAGEVLEGLAFDSRGDRSIRAVDRVVAGDDGRADRLGFLVGELVGVALPGVDGDRDRAGQDASAGYPPAGVPGLGGLLCLPEDRLTAFTWAKTNWERASLGRSRSRSIAPPRRRPGTTGISSTISISSVHASSLGVAGGPRGRRPDLAGLQHQSTVERQPQQERQLAVVLRISPHCEERRPSLAGHAAARYS